jgi:hypothetical protein
LEQAFGCLFEVRFECATMRRILRVSVQGTLGEAPPESFGDLRRIELHHASFRRVRGLDSSARRKQRTQNLRLPLCEFAGGRLEKAKSTRHLGDRAGVFHYERPHRRELHWATEDQGLRGAVKNEFVARERGIAE